MSEPTPKKQSVWRAGALWGAMAVGFGGGYLLCLPSAREENPQARFGPIPSMSPADVVRTQLAALRAFRTDPDAILRCFALASPENRSVTGPVERFAAMVAGPGYRALLLQNGVMVGDPVVRGDRATLLVTVMDEADEPQIFRFFLSKQQQGPERGCWMTDAVISESVHEPAPVPDPALDLNRAV